MELYLDSVDMQEIESALDLGFVHGVTTTPTFMHREGVTDIDEMLLKLAKKVHILQVEALGQDAKSICDEAHRLIEIGLLPEKTVFKIPVSLEGVKACKQLVGQGLQVNIHLVYTLQQAYMAMAAGATYVCPLVGRLQDQGHDALALVQQIVNAALYYGYNSKIMFSSVRHPEHVRNAINIGAHACTIPWKVMRQLTENNFTSLGTAQFVEHTHLMTKRVGDVIREANPQVQLSDTVLEAIVQMTESKLGAVSVLDGDRVVGIFTDGDLRRKLQDDGKGILNQPMSSFSFNTPVTIEADVLLNEASELFREKKIDNIIVLRNGKLAGMLDIQDLVV